MSRPAGQERHPEYPLSIRHAVYSRSGSYVVNEDAAGNAIAQGFTLLAVADGLGGHEGGEVASRLAIERVVAGFQQAPSLEADTLVALVKGAHRALREAHPEGDDHRMRTTLVILVSDGVSVRWAHVGDTRLYCFRDGVIQGRSRDHSVPEMLHRAGEIRDEDIRRHPDRGRLLQALGQETDPKVAVSQALPLMPDEAFLLCSDGWWENLSDAEMEDTLRAASSPDEWLARMADAIAGAAAMPQDNYTAIGVFVGPRQGEGLGADDVVN